MGWIGGSLVLSYLFSTFLRLFWKSGNHYPFNTFLFRPDDRYHDFVAYWAQCVDLNPYLGVAATPTRPYFPFGYLIGVPLTLLPVDWMRLLFFLGCSLLGVFLLKKLELQEIGKASMLPWVFLASYPALFVFDRGNPEALVFVILVGFVLSYRKRKLPTANFLLAMAASMKLTPLLFLLIYLSEGRWKDSFKVILWCIGLTALALWFFATANPGTSVDDHLFRMLTNQKLFAEHYGFGLEGLYFSHSLFGALKVLVLYFSHEQFQVLLQGLSLPYFVFCGLFGSAVALAVLSGKLEFWEKVTLIVVSMLLLPHMSADYKLIHLLIPTLLLMMEPSWNVRKTIVFLCLSTLLVPKTPLHGLFHLLGPDGNHAQEANVLQVLHPSVLLLASTGIFWEALQKLRRLPRS